VALHNRPKGVVKKKKPPHRWTIAAELKRTARPLTEFKPSCYLPSDHGGIDDWLNLATRKDQKGTQISLIEEWGKGRYGVTLARRPNNNIQPN